MGNINTDADTLMQTAQKMQAAIDSIETLKSSLQTKYRQLNAGWNDPQYRELGDLIQEVTAALNQVLKTLLQGEKCVLLLLKSVQEYENVHFADGYAGSGQNQQAQQVTPEAAVRQRLNRTGVQNVHLEGLPIQVQEAIAASFERMAQVFPESVGTIHSLLVSSNMGRSTPASTGYSTQNGVLQTHMNLNPAWFASPELSNMISNCTRTGQWAGNGIGGIINHEIGHAMHLQLDAEELGIRLGGTSENVALNANALSQRWMRNTTTNGIRDTVLAQMGLGRDDLCVSVSEYADTDGSECFAECVADVTTSESPSPISLNIIREYRRRLFNARNGGGRE